MNKLSGTLACLMVLLAIPSCVKTIIMDAKEKPQVVVSCILSDDPVQTLNLSFTKGASLSEALPLTTATAVLFDNGTAVGEFQVQDSGEWTLEYTAIQGHRYRLEVEVPEYGIVSAEQTMPLEPAPIKSMRYNILGSYIEPHSGWVIVDDPDLDGLSSKKWPDDEDYPMDETFYVKFRSADPIWICAMNYNEKTGRHEVAKEICTDANADYTNGSDLRYEPLIKDVPNPYKLMAVVPEYQFAESFRSAHLTELYPALKGKPVYRSFIRIDDSVAQGFYISGSFWGDYCHNRTGDWGYADEDADHKGYILVMTPSVDYDKYLKEAFYYQMIQESTDLSTIYIRDNIHTNIDGGLGIFGARLSRRYPWTPAYTYIDTGIVRENLSNAEGFHDPRSTSNQQLQKLR